MAQAFAKAPLGTALPTNLISRCDVAAGTKGRVIPLFDSVVGCSIIYSTDPKGVFFADQEQAIQAGITPRFYYVIPVARLNTDTKGNVLDNTIKLEYIRSGSSQYDELVQQMEEHENYTSLVLAKETKGEFTFVKPAVSAKKIPDEVLAKVAEIKKSLNEDQIFTMILNDIARPFSEYEKLLKKAGKELGEDSDMPVFDTSVSQKALAEATKELEAPGDFESPDIEGAVVEDDDEDEFA